MIMNDNTAKHICMKATDKMIKKNVFTTVYNYHILYNNVRNHSLNVCISLKNATQGH